MTYSNTEIKIESLEILLDFFLKNCIISSKIGDEHFYVCNFCDGYSLESTGDVKHKDACFFLEMKELEYKLYFLRV